MSRKGIVLGIIGIAAVGWLWLWHAGESARPVCREAQELLGALERECDPDSPDNDYAWLSNSSPTEWRRMELIAKLGKMGEPALAEVREDCRRHLGGEFGEMLVVTAAALGDKVSVVEAAKLMAWSGFPAVRICASNLLRDLKDARTADWFCLALNDDRGVHNDHCGRERELFYPVRANAQVALRELGHSEEEINRWTSEGAQGLP